ncbi:ionotropic receptor 75a-like isoform X1 [Rhodnius prolixus]|uniref:ionotropic receptor 75a-like isoform X1 n=1 Tax=Rhodnius prolixus TaxID=13249 RepID=UPI003D18CC8D
MSNKVYLLTDGVDFLLQMSIRSDKNSLLTGVKLAQYQKLDFYNIFKSEKHPLGTFIDLRCESTKYVFNKASMELMINMSHVFLLYSQNYDEIMDYLQNTSIAFDSDVSVMTRGRIYDLYRIQNDMALIVNEIGSWARSSTTLRTPPIRDNLQGSFIKASMVLTRLEVNGTCAEQQLLDNTFKPQLDVLSRNIYANNKHIESIYNFSYLINITNDWGYLQKDGHFGKGSMFDALEEKTVEVGLTLSRFFKERYIVSFFLPASSKYRTCFIFKHPSTLASYSAFAMPFTLPSWMCTFATIMLSGLCLRMIRNFNIKDKPPNEKSFSASVLVVLGIFCQQGFYPDSFRAPVRILCVIMEVTSVMVYSYYGAEVVGFLLSPSPKFLNTVDKLIESPLKMYSENISYHRSYFTGNVSEKITRAYEKAIKGPTIEQDKFINLEKGLEEVRKGTMALYGQDTNMYTVIGKTFSNPEKCSLFEIEMIRLLGSPVIRKKSPFKELMFRGTMRVLESGLQYRETRKWYAQRPECIGQQESNAVTLEATLLAQVLYASGLIIAIVLFFMEKQHYFLNKNKAKLKRPRIMVTPSVVGIGNIH